MIAKKSSVLTVLAVYAFFAANVAKAPETLAQPRSTFPDFIPFSAVPEGVAVDKVGNVFTSVMTGGGAVQVWRFSPSGVQSILADLGALGGGVAGLATDAFGDVYLAVWLAMPNNGVYRISRRDGTVMRLPGTESIAYPNALAFDPEGTLFVTETVSFNDPRCGPFGQGGIWRIPKGGSAELWLRDDLLTGECPPTFGPIGYPQLGANGIGFYNGNLYVANTDKALIVRVPVRPDGSAGPAELWKQIADVPESLFYGSWIPVGLDGLALDVHGNVYVTINSRAAIVRINADDLSQETIAAGPAAALDVPLGLAFGKGPGERECLFVTNGGFSAFFAPGLPWAGPGLAKIQVGIPGLPLP